MTADTTGDFSRAQETFVAREFSLTFTFHENARLPVCPAVASQPIALKLTQKRFRYYTERLITAKDHAAIQISVVDVDENGVAQGTSTSFAISGPVRAMGESDDSLNRLATKAGRESLWLFVRSFRNSNYCRYFPLGFLVDFVLGFFDFSAQNLLVVSKVDIGSCPPHYTHAIEPLFFLHLELCESGGLRAEVAELRVTGSSRTINPRSPRSSCAQPPAYNTDRLQRWEEGTPQHLSQIASSPRSP